VALIRGAPHPEAARFIDWVGSMEASCWRPGGSGACQPEVDLRSILFQWAREVRAGLVVEPMDWERLARDGDAWMMWWDRHVRGRGASR
jgi:hypothetical protein